MSCFRWLPTDNPSYGVYARGNISVDLSTDSNRINIPAKNLGLLPKTQTFGGSAVREVIEPPYYFGDLR